MKKWLLTALVSILAAATDLIPSAAQFLPTDEECRAAYFRSQASLACGDRLDVLVYPDGRCRFWNTCPVAGARSFVQAFIVVPLHEVWDIRACNNGEMRLTC